METSPWRVMAFAAGGFDLGLGGVCAVGVADVVDDDGCSLGGEADCDGLADARGGTGDECDFACQT